MRWLWLHPEWSCFLTSRHPSLQHSLPSEPAHRPETRVSGGQWGLGRRAGSLFINSLYLRHVFLYKTSKSCTASVKSKHLTLIKPQILTVSTFLPHYIKTQKWSIQLILNIRMVQQRNKELSLTLAMPEMMMVLFFTGDLSFCLADWWSCLIAASATGSVPLRMSSSVSEEDKALLTVPPSMDTCSETLRSASLGLLSTGFRAGSEESQHCLSIYSETCHQSPVVLKWLISSKIQISNVSVRMTKYKPESS